MIIAPELDTFKESVRPSIGIYISSSDFEYHSLLIPLSSDPRTIAHAFLLFIF